MTLHPLLAISLKVSLNNELCDVEVQPLAESWINTAHYFRFIRIPVNQAAEDAQDVQSSQRLGGDIL
jgi:hypothetical protein